jgi:hypothetical protein
VTSLLVLTCVVVLPLASLLLDLYLLDAARTRRHITAITQPPPDDDPGPTTQPSATAAEGDLTWRWPAPKEAPAATPCSPPTPAPRAHTQVTETLCEPAEHTSNANSVGTGTE